MYSSINLANELEKRTLWASELPYEKFDSIVSGETWFKFVILRKPLERFNSYRQMRANIPKATWAEFRSFDPSVKKKLINIQKNFQCKYVSKSETLCNENILANWDLVLIYEEFKSSVALICIFLNIARDDCCLPFVNKKRDNSFPLPELTQNETKYFDKVNWRDIEIYESAKQKFYFQLECLKIEVNQFMEHMQICTDMRGVKLNTGSEK